MLFLMPTKLIFIHKQNIVRETSTTKPSFEFGFILYMYIFIFNASAVSEKETYTCLIRIIYLVEQMQTSLGEPEICRI